MYVIIVIRFLLYSDTHAITFYFYAIAFSFFYYVILQEDADIFSRFALRYALSISGLQRFCNLLKLNRMQ